MRTVNDEALDELFVTDGIRKKDERRLELSGCDRAATAGAKDEAGYDFSRRAKVASHAAVANGKVVYRFSFALLAASIEKAFVDSKIGYSLAINISRAARALRDRHRRNTSVHHNFTC